MDEKEELLKKKALEIGVKYRQADKPTRLEVGKLMLYGPKRIKKKRYKKKKSL